MRQSKRIQPIGSITRAMRVRGSRGRRLVFSSLLTGCLSAILGQSAISQTLAPPVQSVLNDTAMQGYVAPKPAPFKADRSYTALASTTGAVTNRASDNTIHLGDSAEGKVISVTEGEDRIIGEVSAGEYVSTNANQMYGSGYAGSSNYAGNSNNAGNSGYLDGSSGVPSSYMGGSGSYNGYASTGYSNSNPCCPENCHSYYISGEAVFLRKKADESFTLSPRRFLGDFDYEAGGRYTVGQMLDCTDAVEAVYTGPFNWNRARVDQSSTGTLDSIFTTDGGYIPSQINTFNGAIRHIQVERAELQSFEGNRRWFAWDIMSTLIGIRAFKYDESLIFDSVAPDLGAGFFRTNTRNFLLGGQVGADIFRPVGQRLSVGTRTRIGIFANFNRGETLLANRGTYLLNARQRDIDVAGMLQYGALARYRILPNFVATAGYEAWILAGMATVSQQRYTPINPNTGLTYRASDTVFFHGATGGFEITF